jgi:uncharacterized protein (DUF1330 family)
MPKGYWIARFTINDQAKYDAYRALNGTAFKKYGARFLVRGGPFEVRVGEGLPRNVVIEFPTWQAALDCYHSPEYGVALDARGDAIEGDIIIVEGYDGPQP